MSGTSWQHYIAVGRRAIMHTHEWHDGLVDAVDGEGGPAVVHDAAIVIILAVGGDDVLVVLQEVALVAWHRGSRGVDSVHRA